MAVLAPISNATPGLSLKVTVQKRGKPDVILQLAAIHLAVKFQQ